MFLNFVFPIAMMLAFFYGFFSRIFDFMNFSSPISWVMEWLVAIFSIVMTALVVEVIFLIIRFVFRSLWSKVQPKMF